MHSRKDLLTWLKPDLDVPHAERAAALLDAVVDYLDETGPTGLFDTPPPLAFDPDTAASYRPAPVELPEPPAAAARPLADDSDPAWLDAGDLAARIRSGELDRRKVHAHVAERIRDWEPVLNAFARVTLDPDGPAPAGPGGALDGVPIGVHDMIATAGVETAAGSRILAGHVPAADAEAWRRLAADGAVLAGKLGTQEFAAGTTGENDWSEPVRNPWDPTRLAGGACGGAGAAVAAGLITAAIATDPGGSIRVPAALCGVVGLKPTFGAVDRTGSIPLTWTTETLGVLARTTRSTAQVADLLLDGRARRRHGRSCTAAAEGGAHTQRVPLRVGVPESWLAMGLDPEVARAYDAALGVLAALGATLVDVELPEAARIAPAHRAIAFSEASSIHEQIIATRADEYGEQIRARQEAGRGMLASEYLKAWRLRGGFARQFSQAWRWSDIIALPTSPVPAAAPGTASVRTSDRGPEPLHTVYTRYSAPMSTLGLPALSVPCGFTAAGLPVGLQLSAPPHGEPLLFHVAAAYEAATGWTRSHPMPAPSKEHQ